MAITGGDPLNSTFRSRLRVAVGNIVDTFAPRRKAAPTPTAADVEAGTVHAVHQATGRMLSHLAERRSAGAPPPTVAGAGWPMTLVDPLLRTDSEQARIWGSRDALTGRASTSMGITPQAWSTASATDITLERLASIHSEVDHAGILYRKADLDFGILRKDSHMKAQQRARAAAVYRSTIQLRPRDASPLAAAVCAFTRQVVDGIDGFASAEQAMLSAAAYGYAGLEVVWSQPRSIAVTVGNRTVTVREARGINALEWMHPRLFRWHPLQRRMLVQVGGEYFDPFVREDGSPTHKLILHSGDADSDPHNGGYMFSAEPLHFLKYQSVARWSVTLELLGIQTPYMQWEGDSPDGFAPDEDFAAAQSFLGMLGRGRPALLNKKFGEVKLTPAPIGVDARGQHMAIAGYINGELSKLQMGQTLSAEAGGSGSYALSNFQADSKEDVWLIDARNSADTHQAQTLRYIVEENVYSLARAFGASPQQILAVVPRCYRVLDRRIDPVQRLSMFVSAKRDLQLNVDPRQIEEELNIRILAEDAAADYSAAFPPDEPEPAEDDAAEDDAAEDDAAEDDGAGGDASDPIDRSPDLDAAEAADHAEHRAAQSSPTLIK